MSRLADTILTGPYTQGYSAPMVDARNGGQLGYAPNIGQFYSNAAYVKRNLIALVMEAPLLFQYMPDPDYMVGMFKAMIEMHAKTITGLNAHLTVDYSIENAVGGGGEMQQDFADVKRERSRPVFTFGEKYGRPFQNFLSDWITYGNADPDTKVPMVMTLPGAKPTDLLPDFYTGTVLFIEPDPLMTSVVMAWLTTNFAPMGTGEITGKRDLASAMETNELSIEFTGISSSNLGVRMFAQSILDQINLTNANPNLAPAFISGISADVAAQNTGYVNNVEALGASAIVSRGA